MSSDSYISYISLTDRIRSRMTSARAHTHTHTHTHTHAHGDNNVPNLSSPQTLNSIIIKDCM